MSTYQNNFALKNFKRIGYSKQFMGCQIWKIGSNFATIQGVYFTFGLQIGQLFDVI